MGLRRCGSETLKLVRSADEELTLEKSASLSPPGGNLTPVINLFSVKSNRQSVDGSILF